MKIIQYKMLVVLAIAALTACTMFQPKPLPERINDGYITVAAVADEITNGVSSGYYTKEEARGYVNSLVKAKESLDQADGFVKLGDFTSAEAQIKLVNTSVNAARSWLTKQRKAP